MSGHWRVVVTFRSEAEAERVLGGLHDSGEVHDAGGSLSKPDGEPAVWAYVPDSGAAGPVAGAVRCGVAATGIGPLSVRVDEWIPEEMRWSNDAPAPQRSGGGGSDGFEVVELILETLSGFRF